MYTEYFGLREKPFSIAPDPEYLYMSARHREALAHLIYGMQTAGGFVLLTGEVGTGKTTVCRCLLEQIPEDAEIAFVLNPKVNAAELLETICDELRIPYPKQTASIKVFVDAINRFLLETHARGGKTVLIIDEAQNLSIDVLEQIRLLTNLETNKEKLLQVIMIGQPELRDMLKRQELRQLEQRVTARYHLQPLNSTEALAYIKHRLNIAGVDRPLFSRRALRKLYLLSGGVPRLINLLCDRALLGAYVTNQNSVGYKLVHTTAKEILATDTGTQVRLRTLMRMSAAILIVGALVVLSMVFLPPTNLDFKTSPAPVEQNPIADSVSLPAPDIAVELPKNAVGKDTPIWSPSLWDNATRSAAAQQLFLLWNMPYSTEETDIDTAANRVGLSNFERRGSLATLRELNRPAILTLQDDAGNTRYATLTGLNTTSALLTFGEHIVRIPAAELVKHWRGEFILLWQAPPEYSTPVYPGHQGEIIHWLERQLAIINQRQPSTTAQRSLGGTLLDELRQFQASKGLTPDGILGPVTLIHLNNVTSNTHPRLQPDPENQH
ncbi:MAG: AAA family ATPase [Desulfuromonadaceae bacterium]|nr:AAA family ATPase [Desulfuromonas sp.]MDY0185949.1 AAA family ATPase [Desulfuromonadaceae bacterium]